MNELQILRNLAAAADRKPVPFVDVAERALRSVASQSLQPRRLWPVVLAVAAASAAMLLLALHGWAEFSDPMLDFVDSMSMWKVALP